MADQSPSWLGDGRPEPVSKRAADECKEEPLAEKEVDLTPVSERTDYPPLLNAVTPLVILFISAAYAWSLRDVVAPEMNLLLLKPLFIAIWGLLAVVIIKDVVPSIRLHAAWSKIASERRIPWRERFSPGTEAGAGLIVAATFAFAFFGPGHGPAIYVVSAFIYLAVVGYLIGDRNPVKLIAQAAIFSTGLYLIMGVLLGVRL